MKPLASGLVAFAALTAFAEPRRLPRVVRTRNEITYQNLNPSPFDGIPSAFDPRVVESREHWDAIAFAYGIADREPLPPIDFATRTAVAILYLEEPGHINSVRARHVRIRRDRARLHLRRVRLASSKGCAFEAVSYYQFRVLSFPKTDHPVEFVRGRDVKLHLDCRE